MGKKLKVDDIVIIKSIPSWGKCKVKEHWDSDGETYYEVSPLETEGITFLMGLRTQDLLLVIDEGDDEE